MVTPKYQTSYTLSISAALIVKSVLKVLQKKYVNTTIVVAHKWLTWDNASKTFHPRSAF